MTGYLSIFAAVALMGEAPAPAAPAAPLAPLSPAAQTPPTRPVTEAAPLAPFSPASQAPAGRPPAESAGPQLNLHVGFGTFAGSADDCLRMAVATIAAQDEFRFAEVCPDGVVRGYTATCRVAVVVIPAHNGSMTYILVASPSASTGQQLGARTYDRLMKSPIDPKAPGCSGERNPELEKALPSLGWQFQARPVSSLDRHFAPVGTLVLEKRGYQVAVMPANAPPVGIWGTKTATAGVMIMALPGAPGISTNYLIAVTGPNDATTTGELKAISKAFLKILFE